MCVCVCLYTIPLKHMLNSYATFQNEEGAMKRIYKSKTKRLLMCINVMVLQRKKNRKQGREGKKGKEGGKKKEERKEERRGKRGGKERL